MCQRAISLISHALHEVANAEALLKIKGVIALFIQTMDVSGQPYLGFVGRTRLISYSLGVTKSAHSIPSCLCFLKSMRSF